MMPAMVLLAAASVSGPVVPSLAAQPAPGQPTSAGLPPLLETKPAGVSKGMARAQAIAALKAEGFEAWADASVSDQWERFRKPWQGGYHYVNLRFDGKVVAEVGEFWIDP
jgi:hypothetical protein